MTASRPTPGRKAEYFSRKTGAPHHRGRLGPGGAVLGGAPGTRSKRWAGATGSPTQVDAANNAELLRRLAGAEPERRRARYRCVMVLIRHVGAVPEIFQGVCEGSILESPRGSGGFGYDPLFYSAELGKTFGEATPEQKDCSEPSRPGAAGVDREAGVDEAAFVFGVSPHNPPPTPHNL